MKYPIPPFQPQSSPTTGADGNSCPNEVFIGVIEMMQNNFQQFSVSANAVMTGTNPNAGNSIDTVVNISNQKGLIGYGLWPTPAVFTEKQYYAPIPSAILQQANKSMLCQLVSPDLNISPIILRLKLPTTYHFVITVDKVNYIDSYAPQIKPINWSIVVGQWSLKITTKNMIPGFQVAGNPTVYIQVGTSLVPLTDWQAFLNLGGNQQSVVTVTQDWLNMMPVIASDYFQSK